MFDTIKVTMADPDFATICRQFASNEFTSSGKQIFGLAQQVLSLRKAQTR